MAHAIIRSSPARIGIVALFGVWLGLSLGWQGKMPPSALEGTSLTLVDADGRAYAVIEKDAEHGAMFALLDSKNRARLRLHVRGDGVPLVQLADSNGKEAVELSILDEVTPRILLRDSRGVERAKLLLMPDGSPILYLKDRTGEKRVELAAMNSGLGGLILFDDDHRARTLVANLPSHDFEGLLMLNNANEPQIQVGLSNDGKPVVRGVEQTGAAEAVIPNQ